MVTMSEREEQLAYSEQMARCSTRANVGRKARKLIAVIRHGLGVEDLTGLRALDVGARPAS